MSPKEDGDILHHVLSMIFELDDTSPLVKILKSEGWDILSFITESHAAITHLTKANCNIPFWQFQYIDMFSKYFYYCEEYGESLHNNWTSLNKHDFDNWITKCYPSFEKPLIQPISNPPTVKEEEATSMSSNCTDNLASLIYILGILGHDKDSPLTLSLKQACK